MTAAHAGLKSPHRLEQLEPLASHMSATGLARLASTAVAASILVTALAVGIALRTVALNRVPAGFNQDEACNGYDAYCLLRTGRDQHGNFLPITIQAFNDYRMPLFDYSLTVPVGILGLRPVSVRLGAALWGIADLLGVAALAVMLVGLRGAAVATLLLAISPWHLPVSRFAHEAITASATISIAAACFFIAIRQDRGRWLVVSGVMFGLALYSYAITKAFVPPFLLWSAIVYRRELKALRKPAFAGLSIIILSALPQSWELWRHYDAMMARYHVLSVFSLPWRLSLSMLAHGILANLGPRYLFFHGSGDISLHAPGYGQLLVAQAAMLFLAVCSLWEARYRKVAIFLLGWLLIADLTASLILPMRHPLHSILMLTPLTLLSALGMVFLFDLAGASRLARIAMGGAIVLITIIQGAKFVSFYFRGYPALAAYQFQYGLGPAVRQAVRLSGGPVVITDFANQPYIYVLFFTRYPPERFQHEKIVRSNRLFGAVRHFDRYYFADPESAWRLLPHGAFLFEGWQQVPAKPAFVIHSPDGRLAFQVVVK